MKTSVNRAEIHSLTQFELAQLVCSILDLLNHGHPISGDSYVDGWNGSRESIINTLNLRKYYV